MKTVINYIAGLPSGRLPVTFGYLPDHKGNRRMAEGSELAPRARLALQCLVRRYFRTERVIAVRLAQSFRSIPAWKRADCSALIHCDNDAGPRFHYYGSSSTALQLINVTGSAHSLIMQYPATGKAVLSFDEEFAKVQDAEDRPPREERRESPRAETPVAPFRQSTTVDCPRPLKETRDQI